MNDIRESHFGKSHRHQFNTGSMNRRVDNLQVVLIFDGFRGERNGDYFFQIALIHVGTKRKNQFRYPFESNVLYLDPFNFSDNIFVVWLYNL